jgi:S1-C subfamily serine protease
VIPVKVRRGEQTIEAELAVKGDWKRTDIGWRASSWYGLRYGFKVDPVPLDARAARGLDETTGALEVKGIFGKSVPVMQKAGVLKGDVIVKVDGRPVPKTESEFLVELRTQYGPKESVTFTVVRGNEKKDISVPLW